MVYSISKYEKLKRNLDILEAYVYSHKNFPHTNCFPLFAKEIVKGFYGLFLVEKSLNRNYYIISNLPCRLATLLYV